MILHVIYINKNAREGCEETYVESHILLWVEDLEQRRGWVTVIV
jgi:hypothetical protein